MSSQAETMPQVAKNETVAIPFNKLCRSENNMRTIHPEKSSDDLKLLASIRVNGILQNLIVFLNDKGMYEIPAGGRRFGVLEFMVKNDEIPSDFPINCLIIDAKDSNDISLTENFQRLAPHPADTFRAFEKLIAEGATVESISRSHGISVFEVNKLLRLAGLHPVIFELFKSDDLAIEQAMAFASTADTALQIAAFRASGESTKTTPDNIRKALSESRCNSDSALARFVTVETYRDAGGAIESDLFTNTENLLDLPLLTQLAESKLQATADELTGWKWVNVSLKGRPQTYNYTEIPYEEMPVPDDIKAKLQAMQDRIDVINDTNWENTSDELEAKLDEEERDLSNKVSDLEDLIDLEYRSYAPADMDFAGCFVSFDMSDGQLVVVKGLMTSEDLAEYRKRDQKPKDASVKQTSSAAAKNEKPELSGALLTDLGKYRRSIIRLSLASQPTIARNLADFQLCLKVFSSIRGDWSNFYFSALDFKIDLVSDETTINDIEQTESGAGLLKLYGKLNTTWLSQSTEVKCFEAFVKLSEKDRDALVAFAVAQTLLSGATLTGNDKFINHLMKTLGVSLHTLWRPTDVNLFSRLAKPMLLDLSAKWFGKAWTDKHKTAKKSVLVEKLHSLFHGPSDSLNKKQETVRESWIPPEMK